MNERPAILDPVATRAMTEPRQQIRFCTSPDGASIAYAVSGRGDPLVVAPRWLTHLEHDWQSPIGRHWLAELGRDRTLVRCDLRGNGLSDRHPPSFAFERWIEDLAAVVNAAGLERFDLFGSSHGGAVAIAYAARHPERVSRLVLYFPYARGLSRRDDTPQAAGEAQALREIVRLGWGRDDPAYRHVLAIKMMPSATPDEQHALNQQMRLCASGETAAQLLEELLRIDVRREAASVRVPTLVMHGPNCSLRPQEEGLLIASLIPGAQMVALQPGDYFLRATDGAWAQFCSELRTFLSPRGRPATPGFADLTAREAELLELIAHGQDNAQIAARLELSDKTVRNHITAIFAKLQVGSRAQAIVRARDAGYALRPL